MGILGEDGRGWIQPGSVLAGPQLVTVPSWRPQLLLRKPLVQGSVLPGRQNLLLLPLGAGSGGNTPASGSAPSCGKVFPTLQPRCDNFPGSRSWRQRLSTLALITSRGCQGDFHTTNSLHGGSTMCVSCETWHPALTQDRVERIGAQGYDPPQIRGNALHTCPL